MQDGHGLTFGKVSRAGIDSQIMEGASQSAFELSEVKGRCPMDEYKVLAAMAEDGKASDASDEEAKDPNAFSVDRQKKGMMGFSGQQSSFLELDEISNLMSIGKGMHEAEKESTKINARIIKEATESKGDKNTLNDKILASIENMLSDNKKNDTKTDKKEKDAMRDMRFSQVASKSNIKQDSPFGDTEEEANPFETNETGGAGQEEAKKLAEAMKQYQNTEYYETRSVKDFEYTYKHIVKFEETTDKLTTN